MWLCYLCVYGAKLLFGDVALGYVAMWLRGLVASCSYGAMWLRGYSELCANFPLPYASITTLPYASITYASIHTGGSRYVEGYWGPLT